eukprot:c53118_g1_i1.p1 GENE.c53118_g1_i1~~c53118_g1_i1.p1  ORF type:complete len:496 (+),score=129.04 c53118_g1_i1:66-1553(+)
MLRCRFVPAAVTRASHALTRSISTAAFQPSHHLLRPVVNFPLADIGEGIAEVEIIEWFVKEGDNVQEFDKLCEVQSDKANVEITSRYSGKIIRLFHKVGSVAPVGDPLISIDTPDVDDDANSSQTETLSTGSHQQQQQQTPLTSEQRHEINNNILATPAVRALARQNNLDLSRISGTGRDGRIMKTDVLNSLQQASKAKPPTHHHQQPTPPQPLITSPIGFQASAKPEFRLPFEVSENSREEMRAEASYVEQASDGVYDKGVKEVPLKGIAKAMFRSMEAAASIPQFLLCDEVDVTQVVELRKRLRAELDAEGDRVSFSYMPLIVKAASLALTKHPILNSSVNKDKSAILYHSSHNIGVAMDTPHGLLVPNIKDVQHLSLRQIAHELARLKKLADAGKLSVFDTSGGTFTLSNIGSLGGTYASPVVFFPQVAIGAVGKIQELPRFTGNGNEVARHHVMFMSWAADHRVIEGAEMARFSNDFKLNLQNPQRMFLDL